MKAFALLALKITGVVVAVATALIVALLALVLGIVFFGDDPGEGKKADAGRELGSRIIAELDAYRSTHGRFPETLEPIATTIGTIPKMGDGGAVSFDYNGFDGSRYKLTFGYSGPGYNRCYHESDTPADNWSCSGLY